ncbi:hypothetical protein R3P38DRAFT_969904 [Favolaschia claudopus]|uniref:Serpentine receptor class gamma n=1 Tax=Favolaschia claudopus TaxID=2862362 RepID=A0AAW0E7C8_9AGAR
MQSSSVIDADSTDTEFDTQWEIAIPIFYETVVELVFYMIFLAMFFLAAYLFHNNRARSGVRILLYLTSAMFVLGTIQMTLKMVIAVLALRLVRLAAKGGSVARTSFIHERLVFFRYTFLITNNALTDGLFIFRCFVVWGRSTAVTILPMFMLVTTTVLGLVTTVRDNYQFKPLIDQKIPFIMSVATNSILTMLTAGRMWWIGREVRRASTLPTTRSYNTAVVMILESGALYSLCVIAYVVSGAFLSPSAIIINNILTGVLFQFVNIVPTLIAVRVSLSRAAESRWIDGVSDSAANVTFTSIRMRSFV